MRGMRYLSGGTLALLLYAGSVSAGTSDGSLIGAVKARDAEAVDALLRAGMDVNAPAADGATALHWAAYHDALPLADRLLHAGADVDAANDYGVTPLSLACDNGSARMVMRLLDAGADADAARSTSETPLMTCARTGNVDAVRALLDAGANPSAAEAWQGQTALMWAAAEAHTAIVRSLVEHGADVHARTAGGFTALAIAAREDEPELAALLLNAGADVNASAPGGATPLVVATVRGHTRLAMFLLEQGADPNAGAAGYTPLHWAAGSWHSELTGSLRGIETARDGEWRSLNGVREGRLELGADPDVRLVNHPPQFGFASQRFRVSIVGATPFLLAAMDANVAVMDALVAAGADTRLATDEGTTPLMVAAGLGRVPAETRVTEADTLDAVQFVLDLGADVDATNAVGRSALHGAAHIRSDAAVQLLVDHGATVEVPDQRGITPLMIAEGGGHILLPGLGGGSTADLLRALGSAETTESFIDIFNEGPIR
ncbi:MAG: ankyrin repeat domain-containing protein [Acidobacteria bacterium]|nr:ankyrin repeat domain-containing protein [Acidobacteriota bacterium]